MRLSDAIDRIRPSVVQIQVMPPNALPQTIGTGFVVSDDFHVITAKHVVDAVDSAAGHHLMVGFAMPDVDTPEMQMRAGFAGAPGTVVALDDKNDLALLEVAGARDMVRGMRSGPDGAQMETVPVWLRPERLREGVELAASGYPLAQPSLVTNAGILASTFSPDGPMGDWRDRYLGDFTANPGNSGGPVYTVADAAVIGVLVAGRLAPVVGGLGHHAAGLTVVVPVEKVIELMDGAGVPFLSRPSARPVRKVAKGK